MSNDVSMLNAIRKTTRMGCIGIDAVMEETTDRSCRSALRSQYREYDEIREEADRLLKCHGTRPGDVHPLARYGSTMASRLRVRASADPTAKIAEMMVQGNTRGMLKSMHNIRTMGTLEPKVATLSRRLLQTEQANIDQMKQFL